MPLTRNSRGVYHRAALCDLRVGEARIFYDVTETTVEVLAIVTKSEAEPWLAQFGNPE
jgi:hypothetical protein